MKRRTKDLFMLYICFIIFALLMLFAASLIKGCNTQSNACGESYIQIEI